MLLLSGQSLVSILGLAPVFLTELARAVCRCRSATPSQDPVFPVQPVLLINLFSSALHVTMTGSCLRVDETTSLCLFSCKDNPRIWAKSSEEFLQA